MKKITVPKSVRKQAVLRMLKRFLLLLVYLIPTYFIADYASKAMYKDANFGNISFTFAFIYAIPFLASGIPLKLFDRDWYGEILSFEIKNAKDRDIDVLNRRKAPITETALIKAQSGKLYKVPIYDDGELFYGNREKVYRVGDKVIHIYGTDYITPHHHETSDRPIVCVVCGHKSPNGTKNCRHCGVSLEIKVTDKAR